MRISINGKLSKGVTAKDVALYLMSQLTTSGATGYFVELILSYISIYGTPSFLAAPSTHEAANASLISSRGNCILLFSCFISFLFLLLFFCKENANERNESLLSNCRVQLFLRKDIENISNIQIN